MVIFALPGGMIRSVSPSQIPCRKSTHFWLIRKWLYNGCLWENLFRIQSEFSVESMAKNNFLIDNRYKSSYESFRTECSSCRVTKEWHYRVPEPSFNCKLRSKLACGRCHNKLDLLLLLCFQSCKLPITRVN